MTGYPTLIDRPTPSWKQPENKTPALLVTKNGASFLVVSTMPRSQVEALVEDLVQLK